MGIYLNPGNKGFRESIQSAIYVDKTELIDKLNAVLDTRQKYVCISRPRRFGKSMAADMLAAYYDRETDSRKLFEKYKIAKSSSYKNHLNQYDVIKVNMQEFLSASSDVNAMLLMLQKRLVQELKNKYPEFVSSNYLVFDMQDIYAHTQHPFVILIDEWDCLFREYENEHEAQKQYLDFLRAWLKDKEYVALAYMTGILPVKKYGTHSALNRFTEYSMTNPRQMAEHFGFTEGEVKELCEENWRSFEEMSAWYDGYELTAVENGRLKTYSMYNPKSVVDAMISGMFDNYWNQTETFEALKVYIEMNFEGLKDDVLSMIAGESIPVNTGSFTNDMTTFRNEDDVLTLLVHLGYLTYDYENRCVSIPNAEIREEYVNTVSVADWGEVSKALKNSADTLKAIWQMRPKQVAQGIKEAHFETSHLQYNDENALSYTISLALYAARNFYTMHRELAGGKGFADIVFIPRKKFPDKPAMVVELKWNKSAEGAISQIKNKEYCASLEEYKGNLLMVGINYNKKTREHTCIIEEYKK